MSLVSPLSVVLNAGRNTFNAGRNAALECCLQHMLGEAGTVSNFVLDSSAGILRFDLALKGETTHLPVEVPYAITHNRRGTWVAIREVKTSRPWADILAKRFLRNPRRVPGAVRHFI